MFAYEGMIRISASIRQMLGSHSGSLVVVGMGLGLGAIIGAVLYMVRVGAIKIGKRRRSRRKRSSQRSDSNRTLS
jgi:hypothetical protein